MRTFIASRFAAMVSGVGVDWFLVAERCRSSSSLGGPVKARSTSTANPFTMMMTRAARIGDHHAVMKAWADWPEWI